MLRAIELMGASPTDLGTFHSFVDSTCGVVQTFMHPDYQALSPSPEPLSKDLQRRLGRYNAQRGHLLPLLVSNKLPLVIFKERARFDSTLDLIGRKAPGTVFMVETEHGFPSSRQPIDDWLRLKEIFTEAGATRFVLRGQLLFVKQLRAGEPIPKEGGIKLSK